MNFLMSSQFYRSQRSSTIDEGRIIATSNVGVYETEQSWLEDSERYKRSGV